MAREIPFHMRPLWTAAAVSSQQDVLEASHCAALTASLRQLAGVVQHAGIAFEQLHEQTGKLSNRCQQAEDRCQAVHKKLLSSVTGQHVHISQTAGTANHVPGPAKALNSSSVLPDFANTNTLSANVPADSSSEALIKAEYPSAGTIAAPLHGVQTSLTDSPQLTSRQSSSPAKPATIRSGEFSLIGQSRQDTGTQGTMSLSEVPPAVQQSIQYSDAHEPKSFSQTRTMSSDGAASKTQTGIRSAESASSVILPNTTSVDVVPVVNVELSEQPLLRQSAEQADSFQQTTNAERHSIDAGSPMSAKAAMLQQEHSSMSGFHTPSSQPVSRVQSATSSDAFFDTSSHLSSQTASSYISAVNSAAVSSLNSFASSRPAVSTRQSTRDLIGALRQQAGLPHPDAFLSPPDDQEKTVVLPDTEQNVTGARSNAAPVAVAASQSVLQPVVLMQQLPVAAAAASGTSSTAVPVGGQVSAGLQTGPGGAIQEGQNVLLQPEPSGISGTSVRVDAARPSLKLLELISNPLYAKSLDASRTASPPVANQSHVLYQGTEGQQTGTTQVQAEQASATASTNHLQQSSKQHNLSDSTDSAAAEAVASGSAQSASLQAALAEGTVVQESSQPILSGPAVAFIDTVTTAETQHSAEQHNLAISTDVAAAGTAASGSEQSPSVRAALAGGTVMQESSQPILSGPEPAVTDGMTMTKAQPASADETIAAEASANDVISGGSAEDTSEELQETNKLPIAVSEAVLADAAVPDVASTEAVILDAAGPIAQISGQPILTEMQPAPAVAEAAPLDTSSYTAMLDSRELTGEQSAQQASLVSIQTPEASSVAVVDPAEAPAMSQEPILDPASDDVTTVSFPNHPATVAQSAWTSQAEHTASASSQMSETAHSSTTANAYAPQVIAQEVLVDQSRYTAADYSRQVSAQTAVTEQPALTAMLQAPPVPALPSKVRRSRSDLHIAQQPSSASLLSQQSFAQMEAQSSMRRSTSNIQAVSPKPAVQNRLHHSIACLPVLAQTVDSRQTASPVKAASAIPAIPEAPLRPMPVQPVQAATPAVQQVPAAAVQVAVQQQPLSAGVANRDFLLQPAAQQGPVFMRSFGSSSAFRPPALPQAPLAVIQEQPPQLPVTAQQTSLAYNTTVSTPQQMAPYPAPLGSPPPQPPHFMRTNAVPASASFQPMTAAVTVDAQGPLSKGVQDSWNSIPTSVMQQQQPPPITVPQTASSWHQGTLHAPVMASSNPQHFMPLGVSYDSLQMPVLPRVATPSIKSARGMQAPAMRSMQQPAMYDGQQYAVQPQPAYASSAYAVSQGPLRQSVPMMQPAQPGIAAMPYSVSPGTVVQPMSSTVVVGQPNQETQRLAQSGAGFSIVPLQQPAQQLTLEQQIAARPTLGRSQTGGIHASRALQAFSRSRSSIASGEVPNSDAYLFQQGAFPPEPQPAERAESPPTPVAPPASYFHSRDPLPSMSTSHITVPAAPPLPPAPAPVLVAQSPSQQMYGAGPSARTTRAPAFPAHLRPAVASLQVPTQALPVAYQASQGYATQPQQAPPSVSSQSSGQRHFQFQPSGQSMSPQSTPNVSVKSVPRFLEEAWAKGEPSRPPNARQTPPPLPSGFVANMQGGPRHSIAANAMAGWASSDQAATHQRSGTTITNDGKPAGQVTKDMGQSALANEVSLYQSPMSLQSVSSFAGATPSPQSAAQVTPKQATPATPGATQAATAGAPDLLQSIRNGQYHLRKMSFSYQPKGMTKGGQGVAETPLAALTAGSSGLPPAGGNRSRRRNSGSTTGMEAIMKRTQAIRQSVYPESTQADSDSDWEE